MPQLDALRAIAVAFVMWHHWASRYQFGYDWGRLGVTLFFVLSGFLITGILADGRDRGIPTGRMLWAFYARRFLRIFPLFYGLLLITAALDVENVREAAWWHAGFLSNYYYFFHGEWVGPASHFWSIAVEEQFYLIWAALMLWLPRATIPPVMGGLIVASTIYRLVNASVPLAYYTTPAVADALIVGAALAHARRNWTNLWHSRWLPFALLILGLVVSVWGSKPFFQTGCILVSAAAILCAAKTAIGPIGLLLNLAWLRYLGSISYGLYMFHNFSAFIAYDLLSIPRQSLGLQLPLFAAITLTLATISWHFFEKPINDNKQYFTYEPTPASPR